MYRFFNKGKNGFNYGLVQNFDVATSFCASWKVSFFFFSISRALEIENYEEREEDKGQETFFPLKNFLQKSENTEMWVYPRKGQGGMDIKRMKREKKHRFK